MAISKRNKERDRAEGVLADIKGERSEKRVLRILKDNFSFISGIRRTIRHSGLDRLGIDLIVSFDKEATETFGFKELHIQVKSSEKGIKNFVRNGNNFGVNLAKRKIIVLDGLSTEDFLIADFIHQLEALLQARGESEVILHSFFYHLLDQGSFETYKWALANTILVEIRQPVLEMFYT